MKKLILILIAIMFFGCGARKSETTKTDEKINNTEQIKETENTTVKQQETNSETDDSFIKVVEKITETPNEKVTERTTETQNKKSKVVNIYKEIFIVKTKTEYRTINRTITTKIKNTDRKAVSWYYLLIPVLLISILLWVYKKYKTAL